LAAFEKLIPTKGISPRTEGSKGDGTPVGKGFLAYPQNIKFGVRVSAGNIGE
jgi:hypothetical protein